MRAYLHLPTRPAWTTIDPDLLDRIGALLGQRITAYRPALGGNTAVERWICTLEDGHNAFARVAVDTRTAKWLREEYHIYQPVDTTCLPRIELIGWLPSLSVEGGPPPDQLTGPDDAPYAVITAGHFAARAGLPPSSPTSRARISQLMQLKPSLPWACRLVGLDPPDPVVP